MAITGPDGIVAGSKPLQLWYKALSGTLVAGRPHSSIYTAGIPGPAVAPAPGVNGAALTAYPGQIPFTNPGSGNTHSGRFGGFATQAGTLLLCDRLWHNSGLSVTSLTSQAISAPTLPARDINGATNGHGVLIGMEVVTATGAGLNVPTLTYTDQDGNTGATATPLFAYAASSIAGSFYPFGLAAGDTGVRLPTAFQNSVSMTSGSIALVAYRVIAQVDSGALIGDAVDPMTGGFGQMYDDSVPFVVFIPSTTTTSNIFATWTPVQG
jgi:hypothetical protein